MLSTHLYALIYFTCIIYEYIIQNMFIMHKYIKYITLKTCWFVKKKTGTWAFVTS